MCTTWRILVLLCVAKDDRWSPAAGVSCRQRVYITVENLRSPFVRIRPRCDGCSDNNDIRRVSSESMNWGFGHRREQHGKTGKDRERQRECVCLWLVMTILTMLHRSTKQSVHPRYSAAVGGLDAASLHSDEKE